MIVQSGPAAAIVLNGSADAHDELVGAIRDVVVADDPLGAFLAAVAAVGLRAAPDFLFASFDGGGLRLLVRGSIGATVLTAAGSRAVDPAIGVSTWTEHVVDGATDLVLRVGTVEHRIALVRGVGSGLERPRGTDDDHAESASHETILGFGEIPADAVVEEPAGDGVAEFDPEPLSVDMGNLFETRFRGGVEAAAVRNDEANIDQSVADLVSPVAQLADHPPAAAEAKPSPPSARGSRPAAPPTDLIVGVPGTTPLESPVVRPGEHDGLTVSGADLASLRASIAAVGASGASRAVQSITVQAVLCVAGHPNPPMASLCQTCTAAIVDRTIHHVPRPVVGRLLFDSGMVVNVDRRLLIGRKPSVDPNGPVDDLPSLVPLPDPDTLLSRTHAEIRVDGWDLTIVDLGSRNGTFVVAPSDVEPTRLRSHDPYPLSRGMRILFGDVAACRYEAGAA